MYQKTARCQVQKVITYNLKITEQQCVTFFIRYKKSTFRLLTSAPFSDGGLGAVLSKLRSECKQQDTYQ